MKKGAPLPDFRALDQHLNEVRGSELVGRPVVIFFYPRDHSPGCTKEVCAFRDLHEQFRQQGAVIIGVSSDSAETHREFQENHDLPFRLISDSKGKLRKLFGVSKDLFGLLPGRETFVFSKEGRLVLRFNSQLRFEEHANSALAKLEAARGGS